MTVIGDLARSGARLANILYADSGGGSAAGCVSGVVLAFENGREVALGVDPDTDELVWTARASLGAGLADLSSLHAWVSGAYGLFMAWSWEMKNQQGYFDALQVELTDSSLGRTEIIQFKAAASQIYVFRVVSG